MEQLTSEPWFRWAFRCGTAWKSTQWYKTLEVDTAMRLAFSLRNPWLSTWRSLFQTVGHELKFVGVTKIKIISYAPSLIWEWGGPGSICQWRKSVNLLDSKLHRGDNIVLEKKGHNLLASMAGNRLGPRGNCVCSHPQVWSWMPRHWFRTQEDFSRPDKDICV